MKITTYALCLVLCQPSCFPSATASNVGDSNQSANNPYAGDRERFAAAAVQQEEVLQQLRQQREQRQQQQQQRPRQQRQQQGRRQSSSDNTETSPPGGGETRPIEELNRNAESTSDGYASALKKWDEFAEIQNYPKQTELPRRQDFVCGEVLSNNSMSNPNDPPIRQPLSEFANFLLNYKQKSGGEEKHLSVGTQLQYLSGVKTFLFKKFKPLKFYGTDPDWWTDLYNSLRCRAAVAAISRGEAVSKKAIGLSKEAIKNCCRWLMKQENEALGCEERCILVILFHSVGRGGEVSTSTWDEAEWNVDQEFLSLKWGEIKNGRQHEMTFHPDAMDWMLDMFHALACYIIAGPATAPKSSAAASGVHWMFPAYVDMVKGGAASKASRIIEKCRKNGVEGIPDGASSHGIRVTATDDMTFHHLLSVFCAIARGGWDFKSDNLAFHYFTKRLNIVMAGKALAGWHDPRQKVASPTIKAFKTEENSVQVESFCRSLFVSSSVPMLNDDLKGFRDAMVASLLMYFKDVSEELGNGSPIVVAIQRAAVSNNIRGDTLQEWGELVRARFIAANAKNMGAVDLTEQERHDRNIELLQTAVLHLADRSKKQDAQLKTMSQKMEQKMDTVLRSQSKIESMLAQLCITGSDPVESPRNTNNKRLRTESPSPSVAAESVQSSPQQQVSADEAVTKGGAKAQLVNFEGCHQWDCTTFVKQCILQRQDVDHGGRARLWLGNKFNAKKRNKIKKVYLLLKERAPEDKKKYFKASNFPLRDSDNETFAKEVEGFVPQLANDLIEEYLKRFHGDKYDEVKSKKNQGSGMTAIEKLLEKVEAKENPKPKKDKKKSKSKKKVN